jgi:hypothetical protein
VKLRCLVERVKLHVAGSLPALHPLGLVLVARQILASAHLHSASHAPAAPVDLAVAGVRQQLQLETLPPTRAATAHSGRALHAFQSRPSVCSRTGWIGNHLSWATSLRPSPTPTFSIWTEFTVPTGKRSEHPREIALVTRMQELQASRHENGILEWKSCRKT